MADNALLRRIPKVDELTARPRIMAATSPALAVEAVRGVLYKLRDGVLSGELTRLPDSEQLEDMVIQYIERQSLPSLRRLINATGVILHTNLGRAPLAESAVRAVREVAEGYSTLEYNAQLGSRGNRYSHVAGLLTRLTTAEDAMVVNNNAAAVLLVLAALAGGREVIVSRGELVEIGGAFRIPEVMEQSGCTLREVGTTNRTKVSDYERAISPGSTGALLKAHTSNYKIIGFTQEVSAGELAALGQKHEIPFLYDLGSGAILPPADFGLVDEPYVAECVRAGADVVCFSGDKLLGGPQAGIIVGRRELIGEIKRHPLARALRIDKLTLAALEATLRLYLDRDTARREIPALNMLGRTQDELAALSEKLAGMLRDFDGQVWVLPDSGQVGGGSAPTQLLPGVVVAISPRHISVAELERRLRGGSPAIITRIFQDRLILNPRTIDPGDFEYIAKQVLSATQEEV